MARTKGWIRNDKSNVRKPFQFNPENLNYNRGAVYSEIASPGMSYPSVQFVRGEMRSFSVTLFFHNKPFSGVISDYESFLNSFLPPETVNPLYEPPPTMTFCFGTFIRVCVVEDLEVDILEMDSNLKPTVANFTLKLKQVSL